MRKYLRKKFENYHFFYFEKTLASIRILRRYMYFSAKKNGSRRRLFFMLREVERDVKPSRRRVIRLITIQNARAVIFHLFFEALRSDVFNFPLRATGKGGPGPRMQIVTGKLCAAVKLMSSQDRDLIARYILRAPHTYTRAQFHERIYEVTNTLSLSLSHLQALSSANWIRLALFLRLCVNREQSIVLTWIILTRTLSFSLAFYIR